MSAVQLELFGQEAKSAIVNVASRLEHEYEPGIITAEVVGHPWPECGEPASIELISGEFRFDVRGDFGVLREFDVELWCDGKPWVSSKAGVNDWSNEAKWEADRAWIRSRCPQQYLNAGPFIRWMAQLYRTGRAHGSTLVSAFGELFGAPNGATEYHAFVSQLAAHESGVLGGRDLPVMLSQTVHKNAGGGCDAARLTLQHAVLMGWVSTDHQPAPMDWQASSLYRHSEDALEYMPTSPDQWEAAPAWLEDIVHFLPPKRVLQKK